MEVRVATLFECRVDTQPRAGSHAPQLLMPQNVLRRNLGAVQVLHSVFSAGGDDDRRLLPRRDSSEALSVCIASKLTQTEAFNFLCRGAPTGREPSEVMPPGEGKQPREPGIRRLKHPHLY
jgi:hypothetical protein